MHTLRHMISSHTTLPELYVPLHDSSVRPAYLFPKRRSPFRYSTRSVRLCFDVLLDHVSCVSHFSFSNCLRDRSLKQRSHEHKLISFQTTIAISFVCVLYYWPRFAWVDHAIFHISWKYYIYIGACHHHPAFELYRSENSQRQHWPQRYSPSAILACSSRVVCYSQLFILLCMHVSSVSCCLCVLWSERL